MELGNELMAHVRTLLLIDDDPVHAKVFEKALLSSPDGPFQGEWIKSFDKGFHYPFHWTICAAGKVSSAWII